MTERSVGVREARVQGAGRLTMVHAAFRVSFCTDDETGRKAVLDIPIHDFNIVVYVLNTDFVNKGERKIVIDTKFGKRDVTVRTEASMTSAGTPTEMKVYCGSEGVIYKMEYTEGLATKMTTLVESNLLTVGS